MAFFPHLIIPLHVFGSSPSNVKTICTLLLVRLKRFIFNSSCPVVSGSVRCSYWLRLFGSERESDGFSSSFHNMRLVYGIVIWCFLCNMLSVVQRFRQVIVLIRKLWSHILLMISI